MDEVLITSTYLIGIETDIFVLQSIVNEGYNNEKKQIKNQIRSRDTYPDSVLCAGNCSLNDPES